MLGPTFSTWMGVVLTLVVFSFLLKENPAWRLVEHIYIGFAAAHAISMGYLNIKNLAWTPMTTKSQYYLIVPCLLGLMLYTRFSRNYRWVSRYPMAFLIGAGNGMILKGIIRAQSVAQVKATMVPNASRVRPRMDLTRLKSYCTDDQISVIPLTELPPLFQRNSPACDVYS